MDYSCVVVSFASVFMNCELKDSAKVRLFRAMVVTPHSPKVFLPWKTIFPLLGSLVSSLRNLFFQGWKVFGNSSESKTPYEASDWLLASPIRVIRTIGVDQSHQNDRISNF